MGPIALHPCHRPIPKTGDPATGWHHMIFGNGRIQDYERGATIVNDVVIAQASSHFNRLASCPAPHESV